MNSDYVMNISQIELYDLLKSKLGNREARALVEFVSDSVSEKMQEHKLVLATKEDIKNLEVRIESSFKDQLKWLIVLMMGFSSLILALVKFLPLVNA
ncbi:MAG TPA: hypothetical protein VIN08_22170 [Ohtaekwangia sp.]|uniref:hypothetical protein n=1 Tax=Ohtaekwangia sp. TaxID=2066019 RepID=UPI002F922364